jgi:HTH-type transcriptional regulator/antitoxin HigA
MKERTNGLSLDLIIHPGETLIELLETRSMKQKELAYRTGFSEKHISEIINGKAAITSKFAASLENVFDVSAKFWLNLQANYDIELINYTEMNTISSDEISILTDLKEIIKHLKSVGFIIKSQSKEEDVINLRKFLAVSNLTVIPSLQFSAAFRASASTQINPYVLFAWIRLCEVGTNDIIPLNALDIDKLRKSIPLIKNVMHSQPGNIDNELRSVFSECGVKFHIVKHFKGAPVQGFIEKVESEQMMLCMTIRQAWADVFWFTLFHEIGHILNDDVKTRFVDYDFTETEEEVLADRFAQDTLLSPDIYEEFIKSGNFSIEAIKEFAKRENVKPYIIVGRLQKEKHISYQTYSTERARYKWAE